MLKPKIDAIDGEDVFKIDHKKRKQTENNQKPQTQSKISVFFKKMSAPEAASTSSSREENKEPESISIIAKRKEDDIIADDDDERDNVKAKVKCIYSERTKKSVRDFLKENSVAQAYLHFSRKILKGTSYDWKKPLKFAWKTLSGKKTSPLKQLEDGLFEWFLKGRAHKIMFTDNTLKLKALKVAKNMLSDEASGLSEVDKTAYKDFQVSNGWIDKFKKRHNLLKRRVTTKCSLIIDDFKESLQAYFKDLNTNLERTPFYNVYNMDEVPIIF